MLAIRRSEERGRTRLSWLDSRHSFSFGSYLDPAHMGFGVLRVLNEDIVAPGAGFGPHPHRDAEILTIVLEGALEHRDSAGSSGVLEAGDLQRMSAGRGIVHSETNASQTAPVHFLQIWLEPERRGLEPGYEEKPGAFAPAAGRVDVLASSEGRAGGLSLHQDACIRAAGFGAGDSWAPRMAPGRHAWLQVLSGRVGIGDAVLTAGDAAATDAPELPLEFQADSQILFFDLA
jgi:quercetin 2,3-dioxygenase